MAQLMRCLVGGVGLLVCLWAHAAPVESKAKEVEYTSDQIRSPMSAAFGSAVTIGLWPARFGNDLAPVAPYSNGWSKMQAAALLPHARKSFERARIGWWAFAGIGIAFLARRSKNKKKRFSANEC